MSEAARRRLLLLVQVLVSAGLVAIVLRQLDLGELRRLLSHSGAPHWIALAVLAFNGSKIASAVRLNAYQRHGGIVLSELDNARLYYAGMFLNLFLPGGIGGDGYKILVLHRRQAAALGILLRTTLLDRANGLLVLLFLLCALVPFLGLPQRGPANLLAALGAAATAAGFAWLHRRWRGAAAGALARVLACGFVVQLLQIVCMACLLAYLRVPLQDYPGYLAIFLLSSVAAVLPLSFGGLGAREITFFYGTQLLQLEPGIGVAASSGFFLITVASSLLGVFFLERRSNDPAADDAAAASSADRAASHRSRP